MKHLERAIDGTNDWWQYLLVFIGGMIGAQLIGAIPLMVVIMSKVAASEGSLELSPDNMMDFEAMGVNPVFGLALMILPFLIGLLVIIWMIKRFHKRNFAETVNGTNSVRWGRFFFSALVWAGLMAVFLGIDYFLHSDNFEVRFNLSSLLPLAAVSLLLIPFQTTFEELLFRGYLAQGVGVWTKNRWIVLIIPSVLFGLIHFANPEVSEYGFWLAMPQYIGFGLVFGLVAILDDGIECAMGAHAANNVFLSMFVTSEASALQTPALFKQLEVDPSREIWVLLVVCGIFVFIMAKKYNWNFSIMNKKIRPEHDVV